MSSLLVKIKFTANHGENKEGDVIDVYFKIAEHYYGLGVAKEYCECEEHEGPCKECNEQNK